MHYITPINQVAENFKRGVNMDTDTALTHKIALGIKGMINWHTANMPQRCTNLKKVYNCLTQLFFLMERRVETVYTCSEQDTEIHHPNRELKVRNVGMLPQPIPPPKQLQSWESPTEPQKLQKLYSTTHRPPHNALTSEQQFPHYFDTYNTNPPKKPLS